MTTPAKASATENPPVGEAPADDPAARPPYGVKLGDVWIAGALAWAIPGLGHFYQGRMGKGCLFSVCILGMFVFGLVVGEGRVVQAALSTPAGESHWWFIGQAGVGLPAMPAVIQAARSSTRAQHDRALESWTDTFMAPPLDLPEWQDIHLRLNRRYEIGAVYTATAGLLNLLAICDAIWGPALGYAMKRRDPGEKLGKSAKAGNAPPPAAASASSTAVAGQ